MRFNEFGPRHLLVALIAVTFAITLRAEDWPSARGPRGDLSAPATGLAAEWPADGPKKLWSLKTGLGYASPVAVGGKVYLFSEVNRKETLTSYDAASGKPAWSEAYDLTFPGNDAKKTNDYPGTRATPTIADGFVYTYGTGGELTCRQLADGKQVWRVNPLKETGAKVCTWGQASSPLVSGDLVYVQLGEGGPVAVAVNKKDGKIAWKSEAGGGGNDIGGYALSIIAEFGGQPQLVIFGGKAVYGMDPMTGKTLWREEWKSDFDINAAAPIASGDNLFVTSSSGAMMLKVSAGGVQKAWKAPNREVDCKFQGAILDNGYVYANAQDKRGTIKCMAWPSGEIKWACKEADLKLDFGGSVLRVGNDRLIAMSQKGVVSLISATPAAYKKISQFEPFDDNFDKDWATPLVYDGKLYVKGKDTLACFDISGK